MLYLLETKLSEFPVLYQGQKIEVKIFDKAYLITVEDIEQDFEDFDFEKGTSSLELNVILSKNKLVGHSIKLLLSKSVK